VQSIGKPPLACPSGEQITNGGFETGDFTGWTATGDWVVSWEWAHSGLYGAMILTYYETVSGTLRQNFATSIPVACFTATSAFEIWAIALSGCIPSITVQKIEIIYTDDSVTEIDLSGLSPGIWTRIDLKSVLQSGKTVKAIQIVVDAYDAGLAVDDCSLVI